MKPKSTSSSENTSKLFGLVLSGGASTRMGRDKGLLDYHGIPQREYVYNLLDQVCDKVFLSIREQQLETVPKGFKTIVDQNRYKGPFNGILSAFDAYPDVGWLVLACDLPLMTLEALQQLVVKRQPDTSATAFVSPETGEPEPLACIWEPKGLEKAKAFLQNSDQKSPKKFLMNTDSTLVHAKDDQVLFNANSVLDHDIVKKKLLEREGS
ncbi:NTP transferase domain-containing protein [[Muricauda] lutisoli]|nr:NTP transferase domain-containing protein [[Muricauda] lutisoli]